MMKGREEEVEEERKNGNSKIDCWKILTKKLRIDEI